MSEDETTEVLIDLREQIEALPRFNDQGGIHQDNQTGKYLERDAVLGIIAMYLGGHEQ